MLLRNALRSLFQYFSPFFYAGGAGGIGYKTFAAAKVLLFFEIYKKFCTFDAELIVLGVWSKFLGHLPVIGRWESVIGRRERNRA